MAQPYIDATIRDLRAKLAGVIAVDTPISMHVGYMIPGNKVASTTITIDGRIRACADPTEATEEAVREYLGTPENLCIARPPLFFKLRFECNGKPVPTEDLLLPPAQLAQELGSLTPIQMNEKIRFYYPLLKALCDRTAGTPGPSVNGQN